MAKKKKEEKLSKRQRQSKRFMRNKELQLKRQHFMQKFRIIGTGFLIILIVGGGIWSWKTSVLSNAVRAASDKIYALTVMAGYSVQNLYLEGRDRTPMEEINTTLDIDKNTPILRLQLDEIRARLEKIESIKYAAVERSLPNSLYVRIIERDPVALWQYKEKIVLVDDKGVVMSGLDIGPYKSLPLIVGEDAPKHVANLLALLAAQPELAKRFAAAVWVGERRWNIRMRPAAGDSDTRDIEVLLPENNPLAAWKQLAELQKKQQVLDRDVKVIDLRIDGRLFIKLPASEARNKPSNAKEI